MGTPQKLVLRTRRFLRRHVVPKQVSRLWYRARALEYLDSLKAVYDPNKKTILAVNHYYDQDLRALGYAAKEYNLIVVDAPILFKGVKVFFTQDTISLRAPYETEPLASRLAYRAECRLIFQTLRERFKPQLIVTANDNFAFIREFIHVAHDYGVPTVIIDKEGTIAPHTFEHHAHKLKRFTPCISDHVFVWSERQKSYWRKIGVTEAKISVIGQPRSDLFYREQTNRTDRYFAKSQPLVTFFSYEDTAYVPPAMAGQGMTLAAMKHQTHELLAELAHRHPEFNFAIKTHPQQSDRETLRQKYRAPNLAVIGGADIANELILRSELVILFQTTAAMEAMFMNKPVVYTAWDKNYRQLQKDMLPLHDAPGIVVADSFEKLRTVTERFLEGDRSDFDFPDSVLDARRRFVDTYFYKPDGHVCERFFEKVKPLLT